MTFSDDDLKRLKDYYEDPARGDTPLKWKALIARLEAAEVAYLAYRNDPEVRHTPEQVQLGIAWRTAAGKPHQELNPWNVYQDLKAKE